MIEKKCIHEVQYEIVATRRQSFDSMLWQTPALSLTAQAFLWGAPQCLNSMGLYLR